MVWLVHPKYATNESSLISQESCGETEFPLNCGKLLILPHGSRTSRFELRKWQSHHKTQFMHRRHQSCDGLEAQIEPTHHGSWSHARSHSTQNLPPDCAALVNGKVTTIERICRMFEINYHLIKVNFNRKANKARIHYRPWKWRGTQTAACTILAIFPPA